jgi:hypothetical protein
MPNGRPFSGANGTVEFASSAIAFRRIDYWLKSAGECRCAIVPSRASVTGEAAKRPNSGIDEYWWGVPPMNIEDSRIIARFQGLLTESLVASRLGQWRPELKDALYQMMFEALAQRDLKKTPEYRNVMLRADQHAEWLAGLARLCTPDVALPISSKETERAGTPTALEKAA